MPDLKAPLPALALSLAEDPFYRAISVEHAGSRDSQLVVLEKYFGYSLSEAQRTGRCMLAADASDGAAAWLLPRSPAVEAAESAAKVVAMAEILGPRGSAIYHSIVNFMAPVAERHVPADAWYLSIVGVHPGAQGRGLGQSLLRPTLDEASSSRKVCYLETFTQRNIAFYERLGFEVVADQFEPVTGSDYVVMRRDVRSAPRES